MILSNQINFLNNKILNKEYFGKFFIRSLKIDNKNIFILDNNYSQFNASTSEFNKFLFTKKSKLGYSFKIDIFNYKNKLNNLINFKSYILSQKHIENNYTQKFLNSLKIIKNNTESFLFLTNPNKGGFICYSYGFLGFIPKNHCNFFLIKFLKEFKNYSKKKDNLIFYFNYFFSFKKEFSFFNVYSKYFILNVNFFQSKTNFVKIFKRRNKNFKKNNSLNFIFLIKN